MKSLQPVLFCVVATILVAAGIVAGLTTIGSPQQVRAFRLDHTRIANLSLLSQSVNRFRQSQGRLPRALEDLRMVVAPNVADPETGLPYEYRTTENDAYELCADFTDSNEKESPPDFAPFWEHGGGRHCFRFEAAPK